MGPPRLGNVHMPARRSHHRAKGRIDVRTLVLLLASLAVVGPPGVLAQEREESIFTFQGFGTIGVVRSSEEQADFLGSLLVARGAGHTAEWSAEIDTRLGGQLTARVSPRLSGVVQVVAEQGPEGSWEPRVEWANLKLDLTPNVSLRAGRVVLSSFLASDHRKVGFASHWVRPPSEVYSLVPVSTNDGVDGSWRFRAAEVTTTVQAHLGAYDSRLSDGSHVKARDSWGLTATAERGHGQYRLAYQQAALTIERFNQLFDAFRAFGPEGIEIARRFDAAGASYEFVAAGASYDPGRWFVMAEWGRGDGNSAVGVHTAWYVSGGYRHGKLTPFIGYSRIDADRERSHPGLTQDAYPPELGATILGLNAGLNSILGAKAEQSSATVGLRWDRAPGACFKIQVDFAEAGSGSPGLLDNLQPEFVAGGRYTLLSLSYDFLF